MTDTTPLSLIFDALPYPVFAKNSQHTWIYVNRAFEQLVGKSDLIGQDDRNVFDAAQVEVFWREDDLVFSGEESLNEEEVGENRFALTKKVPLNFPDGSVGLVGIIIDFIETGVSRNGSSETAEVSPVSENTMLQKRLEDALAEKKRALEYAHTDAATGLRNRRGFEADLEACLDQARDNGLPFGVAILDIDHFKRINDRFGHSTGDEVLYTVSERLRALPSLYCAARIGGDEFAIITAAHHKTEREIEASLAGIRNEIFRPMRKDGKQTAISGSSGICVFPRDASSASELLRRADLALYEAKREGRGRSRVFDEQTQAAYRRRLLIEDSLDAAIDSGGIKPVYQPIVSSDGRRPVGLEVLARWVDDDIGVVGPDEFIEIATDTGKVSKLDQVVSDSAMREASSWLHDGLIEFVSLNVSPVDVITPGYATSVIKRIKSAGLLPEQVCLEILESSIVEDVVAARRNLRRLQEAGVQIALDDYGTGFSNMRALLDMPLDKLKIDRSLVAGIEEDDKVLDMVISLVQFGKSLGLTLIAEGVETRSQAAFIEGAGCPNLQGFHFAKPANATDTDCLLRRWNTDRSADQLMNAAS